MPRKRPRKLLAACAASAVAMTLLIDKAVPKSWAARLHRARIRLRFVEYQARYAGSPDDIFIVTYPKSGTTWLQMIVYQLTTDGAMDFTHIAEVSPHLEERMMPRGLQISDLRSTPRVVKSHLPYFLIPRGPGRYIYGVRNGLDVAVSYRYHARKYLPRLGEPSAREFFDRFMAGDVPYRSWFEHVAGWLGNRNRLNVLVITYDELVADLEAGIRRIADFCGITIDPAAMPRIVERCSFAFMREHDAKFALKRPPAAPAPTGREPGFIRKGGVGGWREELDAQSVSEFHEACQRHLGELDKDMFRILSGRDAREAESVR
ncbi:MAG TPA: sulfotransferase domain-containing protein [Longimicrobium sp.]|nr:sulfotransferase domain-containing protein [Longimicrobium sp.]